MTGAETAEAPRSNAYNIFMLILTVLSLVIMVLLLLPLPEQVLQLLTVYDNSVCVIFLIDFTLNMRRSSPKRKYFINERGWLDLIGSIPSFGVLRLTALLRIARLSRLARITRLLRGNAKKAIVEDVLANRGQYAAFITLLSAFLVLVVASILVLEFESSDPNANIVNGGDALWWAVVTITTVGYGDFFPVTTLGRLTGFSVMLAGVGIIGALASILASMLVSPSKEPEAAASGPASMPGSGHVDVELAAIRAELVALRLTLVEDRSGRPERAPQAS